MKDMILPLVVSALILIPIGVLLMAIQEPLRRHISKRLNKAQGPGFFRRLMRVHLEMELRQARFARAGGIIFISIGIILLVIAAILLLRGLM